MKKEIILLLLISAILSSCFEKRCADDENYIRTFNKDTALMYMWRRIEVSSTGDSGFIGFKPDGDLVYGDYVQDGVVPSRPPKSAKTKSPIWYSEEGYFYSVYCFGFFLELRKEKIRYEIKNDTMYQIHYNTKKMAPAKVKVYKYDR